MEWEFGKIFRKNVQQTVALILPRDRGKQKCKWIHKLGGGKWREFFYDRIGHLLKVREKVAG